MAKKKEQVRYHTPESFTRCVLSVLASKQLRQVFDTDRIIIPANSMEIGCVNGLEGRAVNVRVNGKRRLNIKKYQPIVTFYIQKPRPWWKFWAQPEETELGFDFSTPPNLALPLVNVEVADQASTPLVRVSKEMRQAGGAITKMGNAMAGAAKAMPPAGSEAFTSMRCDNAECNGQAMEFVSADAVEGVTDRWVCPTCSQVVDDE